MSGLSTASGETAAFHAIEGSESIPLLENGDRLTLNEYMRRYEAMPEGTRAQLIEGIVYLSAATRIRQHGRPYLWLTNVVSNDGLHTGLDCGGDSTVELDERNAPEPDLVMFLPEALGGRAKVNAEGDVVGAPDFVAEVSASTASIDLHGKLRAYERSGVREHVVWRVLDQQVDWFVIDGGKYRALAADASGIYRSLNFPGLWLDVPALLAQDIQRLWATLDAGMATTEYRQFAGRVKAATRP